MFVTMRDLGEIKRAILDLFLVYYYNTNQYCLSEVSTEVVYLMKKSLSYLIQQSLIK